MSSRTFFLGALMCLSIPGMVEAYNPILIETPDQNEVMPLTDPHIEQTIYGGLAGYPHMFEFAIREPMTLALQIWVPDTETARDNVSGIVLYVNKNGSVREVARLRAREAGWEPLYEPWGGDSYRRGGAFRETIEPGTYRIEISTPDNIGTYALNLGTEGKMNIFRYAGLLSRIFEVKAFLGKSPLRMVESPLVYGPVALVFLGIGFLIYRRRREGVQ